MALTPSSDLTLALQRFAAFLPTQAQFCLSLFFLRHVVESAHAESKESPPSVMAPLSEPGSLTHAFSSMFHAQPFFRARLEVQSRSSSISSH